MNRHSHSFMTILALLSLVVFQGVVSQKATAAPKAQIGKIDLKAVVLLHPAMRSFDPYIRAFRVDPAKVPQAVMKQKADEQKGEVEKLDAQARLLQGRIHETRRKFDREMERLANNYLDGLENLATGPRALKKKEYDIAKNRTESSYNARLQALGAQLNQTEEKRDRLGNVAYNVGFTDPDATQKQFAAIINEIRQYTQQIATQKGIEVVLNSRSRELRKMKSENTVMAPELNYERLFSTPFPNEIRNDSAAISGYYQNLTSMAANWLAHGNDILNPFSSQIVDNDIFIGGVDLTAEVLAAIFRTYKIDANIGNAVIQAVYTN